MSAPTVEPYNIPVAEGIETWEEFSHELRWTAFGHRLEFRIRHYAMALPNGSKVWRREYFAEEAESGAILPQPDFDKGDRVIEGVIKWDGCAHLTFGDNAGYLHVCGEESAQAIRFALRRVFDLAREHVPAFDPKPFDWTERDYHRDPPTISAA